MISSLDLGKGLSFIADSEWRPYLRPAMLRFLSSFFIALTLLVSPLAMAGVGGSALANAPSMRMMIADGHCAQNQPPPDDQSSHVQINCVTACAGIPAVEPIVADVVRPIRASAAPTGHPALFGVRPEGETPPPRITSEI